MAIKHIVTMGFGFADGIKFIPTLGYSSSIVTIVGPPFYVDAIECYVPGSQACETYVPGAVAMEAYVPGVQESQAP